eukprot:scaffold27517_cov61-Phaeocystis_antarctica.AAC.1
MGLRPRSGSDPRQNQMAGRVGAMPQAVSLAAVMPSRLLDGSAPVIVPGGKASAGQSWHGLARCGGWPRSASCGSGGGRVAREP